MHLTIGYGGGPVYVGPPPVARPRRRSLAGRGHRMSQLCRHALCRHRAQQGRGREEKAAQRPKTIRLARLAQREDRNVVTAVALPLMHGR